MKKQIILKMLKLKMKANFDIIIHFYAIFWCTHGGNDVIEIGAQIASFC